MEKNGNNMKALSSFLVCMSDLRAVLCCVCVRGEVKQSEVAAAE